MVSFVESILSVVCEGSVVEGTLCFRLTLTSQNSTEGHGFSHADYNALDAALAAEVLSQALSHPKSFFHSVNTAKLHDPTYLDGITPNK
jgi:hypothetical protein